MYFTAPREFTLYLPTHYTPDRMFKFDDLCNMIIGVATIVTRARKYIAVGREFQSYLY